MTDNQKIMNHVMGVQSLTPPTVTKPWSKEMYEWNDMVAEQMKAELRIRINQAEEMDDRDALNELLSVCGGIRCGDGYNVEEMWDMCLQEVDRVPNYWLNEEWEYAVSQGIVSDCVKVQFVGY
tara:strand:+ start:309 stop:677 length:369 start_codon:yes stop_codon:yes gene_type:complete